MSGDPVGCGQSASPRCPATRSSIACFWYRLTESLFSFSPKTLETMSASSRSRNPVVPRVAKRASKSTSPSPTLRCWCTLAEVVGGFAMYRARVRPGGRRRRRCRPRGGGRRVRGRACQGSRRSGRCAGRRRRSRWRPNRARAHARHASWPSSTKSSGWGSKLSLRPSRSTRGGATVHRPVERFLGVLERLGSAAELGVDRAHAEVDGDVDDAVEVLHRACRFASSGHAIRRARAGAPVR